MSQVASAAMPSTKPTPRAAQASTAPSEPLGNPLALFISPTLWASVGYVTVSVLVTAVWFGLTLAVVLTGVSLSVIVIGLPVLAVGLGFVRMLATVERVRVPASLGGPLRGEYRQVEPGIGFARWVTARLTDAQSWRDVVYLVVLWPVLFILDVLAFVVWLVAWGLISVPFWYRFPVNTYDNGTRGHGIPIGYVPNGPHEGPHYGVIINSLGSALITAGIGLLVMLLFANYVISGVGRLHAAIARGMLGQGYDPLAPARAMLESDPELDSYRGRGSDAEREPDEFAPNRGRASR